MTDNSMLDYNDTIDQTKELKKFDLSLTHKKHTFRHLPILKHLAPCVHDYLLNKSVTESYPHRYKVPFKANE